MIKKKILLAVLPFLSIVSALTFHLTSPVNVRRFKALTIESQDNSKLSGEKFFQYSHNNLTTGKNLPEYSFNPNRELPANKPGKAKKLPGIFRGDWGAIPVYAKNDRVDFQGSAYLSLLDENQNQPPDTRSAYWRFIRKNMTKNSEECFAAAPAADLAGCDFSATEQLKDADLAGAKLLKARLGGELGAANLSGADLRGASVIGRLVIGPETLLYKANLSGLQSDGNNPVIAESANLNQTDFTNASLYGAKMKGADFSGSTLVKTVLTGSDLSSARFQGTKLKQANLTYSNLSEADFDHADLSQADVSEANLDFADFSAANLNNANFAGSSLESVNLAGADLRGANFSGVKGAETAVIDHQTDFTAAICPDGATVDGTQVTTCVGHGF